MFWKQSGDRINTLNGMVTYGNSGDRLDASLAPDGAIYIEEDRSGVIYQNQGGEWHYVAGTMYGTISPDERSANLGANDAGFEFRSIDTNPLLGGHYWIWSGSAWIETTPNRYNGHAVRLAIDAAEVLDRERERRVDGAGAERQLFMQHVRRLLAVDAENRGKDHDRQDGGAADGIVLQRLRERCGNPARCDGIHANFIARPRDGKALGQLRDTALAGRV